VGWFRVAESNHAHASGPRRRGTLGEMLLKHAARQATPILLKQISRVKTVAHSVTVLLIGVCDGGRVVGIVGPLLGLH